MIEVEARKALKAVHTQASKATKQLADLEESLERAGKIVDAAEAELKSFEGLEAEISRVRVVITKNGGNPKDLPQGFKDRIQARRDAEEELQRALDTRELLQNELEELEASYTPPSHPWATNPYQPEVKTELQPFKSELQAAALQVLRSIADSRTKQISELREILSAAIEASRSIQTDRWKESLDSLLADPDAKIILPREITEAENAIRALKG